MYLMQAQEKVGDPMSLIHNAYLGKFRQIGLPTRHSLTMRIAQGRVLSRVEVES